MLKEIPTLTLLIFGNRVLLTNRSDTNSEIKETAIFSVFAAISVQTRFESLLRKSMQAYSPLNFGQDGLHGHHSKITLILAPTSFRNAVVEFSCFPFRCSSFFPLFKSYDQSILLLKKSNGINWKI